MKAHIKITVEANDEISVVTDTQTELNIKDNTYYFAIDGNAQEINIEENILKIIRPEMTIVMELGKVLKNTYKNNVQDLKLNFRLEEINKGKNHLHFRYSLVSNQEGNDVMQTMRVKINY